MAEKIPMSVSDWQPKTPSGSRPELLMPDAKDNPDSLTPTNELKRAPFAKGTPAGPFGKKGREF